MFDPIGGFERIRDQYLVYLETAFRIADPQVSSERRHLLEQPGQLCTEPLLEPIPRYESVEWTIDELASHGAESVPGISEDAARLLAELIANGLFDHGGLALYRHQADMLRRGTTPGCPGIVTSGTGSGKTESFLLPVFASILDEGLRHWTTPEEGFLSHRWWHDPSGQPYEKYTEIPRNQRPLKRNPEANPFVPHRAGERRDAAVRCLIVYPMNALVEDQLARLRKALDSEAASAVLTGGLNGNRIFFGRYTSETPVTGFNEHPRIPAEEDRERRERRLRELFDRSTEMEETQQHVRSLVESGALDGDDRYLFPSVDGAELISRWDMQQTPPDILITNISMLGAMLNREVDADIFEQTKTWIEANDDAYFFLVLDELHLHRGTAGTEVAYLVRMLLDRLGLTRPEHRHSSESSRRAPRCRRMVNQATAAASTSGTCSEITEPSLTGQRGRRAGTSGAKPSSPANR